MNPLDRMKQACLYTNIAPQWRIWIESEGEKGEKPPNDALAGIMRMVRMREEAVAEPVEEKRIALTLEICKILEENLWWVGGMLGPETGNFWMVNNRLANVRDVIAGNGELIYSVPAQYYFIEK